MAGLGDRPVVATGDVTTATEGCPAVVHRGRQPASADRVARSTGIRRHRCGRVCLGAGRCTAGSRAIMAGRTVVCRRDPRMRERSRQPGRGQVATTALRIGARRVGNVVRLGGSKAIPRRRVTARTASEARVVHRRRHPACTDGVARPAGIVGQRSLRVSLGSRDRTPCGRGPVMTSVEAICRTGHAIVSTGRRLPRGSGVAG